MANPVKPEISYSYTGFQQEQQDAPFPGTQLDNDLQKLAASDGAVIDALIALTARVAALENPE